MHLIWLLYNNSWTYFIFHSSIVSSYSLQLIVLFENFLNVSVSWYEQTMICLSSDCIQFRSVIKWKRQSGPQFNVFILIQSSEAPASQMELHIELLLVLLSKKVPNGPMRQTTVWQEEKRLNCLIKLNHSYTELPVCRLCAPALVYEWLLLECTWTPPTHHHLFTGESSSCRLKVECLRQRHFPIGSMSKKLFLLKSWVNHNYFKKIVTLQFIQSLIIN